MTEWCHRPLDAVYPVIFIDAIHIKVRDGQVTNRAFYLAVEVTVDGRRDILGLWAGRHRGRQVPAGGADRAEAARVRRLA
jgi:transposase-like protein